MHNDVLAITFCTTLDAAHDIEAIFGTVSDDTIYMYPIKKLSWWGQTCKPAIPGQCCFELVSSHQQ